MLGRGRGGEKPSCVIPERNFVQKCICCKSSFILLPLNESNLPAKSTTFCRGPIWLLWQGDRPTSRALEPELEAPVPPTPELGATREKPVWCAKKKFQNDPVFFKPKLSRHQKPPAARIEGPRRAPLTGADLQLLSRRHSVESFCKNRERFLQSQHFID